MVNVDIEKDLYEDIKKLIKENKYSYPSIKFFVQKAIYNELLNTKDSSNDNYSKFYLKMKDILKDNPQLMNKINEIYSSEFKISRKKVIQ